MYYNAINTARGLLDGLTAAERVGDEDRAEEFRAQLRAVTSALDAFANPELDEEEQRLLAEVRAGMTRMDASGVEGGAARAKGRRGGARTAKAAAAPEAAVPPATE